MKLERWGWYSVLVNVLLASLHGLIAWMSGSLAVFAELVHNLIDLLGAVAVLVGIPMVTQLNWVTGRNAGRYRFVEAGLSLRATSRKKVEVALRRIENAVRKAVPRIERLVVQLEPAASADACYALPLAEVDGPISEHFGEAPYFVILTLRGDDQSLVERRVVSNPYRTLERGKGIRVAEWLIGQKVDVVLSREVLHGRGPAYVFRDAGVELKATEAQEVDVAISQSTIQSVSD